jgi:hypothetical protein
MFACFKCRRFGKNTSTGAVDVPSHKIEDAELIEFPIEQALEYCPK